jgi:D-sedoheptulose 7-phosphate isomerase
MADISTRYQEYLKRLHVAVSAADPDALDAAATAIAACHARRGAIFVLGNGGSASTATHLACDLSRGTVPWGARGPNVWALTDNIALVTATANDVGYEHIFAHQLLARATRDDVVLAVSGSGNSPNVLRGVEAARELGCTIIAFTGFTEGRLQGLADIVLHAAGEDYGPVEDAHLVFNHFLVEEVRRRLGAC